MSLLNDPLTKCWMVNDTKLSDIDSVIPFMYLVVRHETPRMLYLSTLFFDSRLIGLEVPNLAQLVIGSDS